MMHAFPLFFYLAAFLMLIAYTIIKYSFPVALVLSLASSYYFFKSMVYTKLYDSRASNFFRTSVLLMVIALLLLLVMLLDVYLLSKI